MQGGATSAGCGAGGGSSGAVALWRSLAQRHSVGRVPGDAMVGSIAVGAAHLVFDLDGRGMCLAARCGLELARMPGRRPRSGGAE